MNQLHLRRMQDAAFTALFGNARYSRTTPHLVILHIRTRGIAILIEPGCNSLAQKDCYIHVPGEKNAEVLARIAICVGVPALVVRHAALQRIVGGQLGQSRIPGHGAHVPCAGKAAHSPASDQVAALVVQLQDQRDLGVHCNKLPAATAHEALFQAVESKPKSILFCFSFKFKDFLSLDH